MPNSFNIWKFQNIRLIDYAISLSVNSLTFSAVGETKSVFINTELPPTDLNVTINSDDFSFSFSGYEIQITAHNLGKNESLEKKATLTVTNGKYSVTCALSQEANVKEYKEITISSLRYPEINPAGGTSVPEIGSILQKILYTSGSQDSEEVTNIEFTLLDTLEGISIDSKTGIITCPLNASTENRSIRVRLTASANGYSTYIDATCIQAMSYKTYADPIVSLTYSDIPAGGGTVYPSLTYSQTWGWNGSTTGGGITNDGGEVSYSGAGQFGEVSALSKGTDRTGRTLIAAPSVTVSLNGKTGGASAAVYQEANDIKEYSDINIAAFSYANVAGAGGKSNPIVGNITQQAIYTSEAQSTIMLQNPSKSYSIVSAISGASVAEDTGIVTWTGNESLSTRSVTIRLTVTANGKTATKDAVCIQYEGTKSYSDITVILSYPIIPAKGGTVYPSLKYNQTWGWNGATVGGGVISDGGEIIWSKVTDPETGAVYAPSKGTDILPKTSIMDPSVTVKLNGKEGGASATVYQEANEASYGEVTIYNGTVSDIPASGGSVTEATGITASQIVTYTSETIRTPIPIITYPQTVTAESLYDIVRGRERVGSLTAQATGEGDRISYKYFDVYQEANEETFGNVVFTSEGIVSDIPASGGTIDAVTELAATQTVSYTSGSTRTVDAIISYSDPVSAPSLGTTLSSRKQVGVLTATATGEGEKTATKEFIIYQQENTRTAQGSYGGETVWADVVGGSIQNGLIPASGGSATAKIGTGTQDYVTSATYTKYYYTSTETKDEVTIPEVRGTETIQPSITTITASATSKGTVISDLTIIKQEPVTWTGVENKKASATAYIYQEANKESYGDITFSDGEVYDIPASGGQVDAITELTATQVVNYTSKATSSIDAIISYSDPVIAESLGTTITERKQVGTLIATATGEEGVKATKEFAIYQQANVIKAYEDFEITGGSIPGDIPAKGGSITASGCSASQSTLYTSGDRSHQDVEITYTTVSAGSLGTDVTQRLQVGSSVATANGLGGKTATKSFPVYQEANDVVSAYDYQFNTTDYQVPSTTSGEPQNYTCNNATALATYTSGESARRPIPTGIRKASEADTFYSLSRVQVGEETTSFRLTTEEDNTSGKQRIAYLEGYDATLGTVISNKMHRVIQDSQTISGTNINLHNATNSTCRILSTNLSVDLSPGQEYAFTIIPEPSMGMEYITYQYLDGTVSLPSLVLTGSDPSTILLTGSQSGQTVTFIIDNNFKNYVSTMGREIYLRERTE